MPYANNKVYVDTDNNLGISIADIQAAVGSSRNDIGGLIVNGTINPMAKYKPVKSSKLGILTVSERASARYGMVEPSYFYPNSFTLPDAWSYNRPTAGKPNEWFRFLDFDGYDSQAVPPLAMEVPGGLRVAETFATLLWKDGYVNNYLAGKSSARWEADSSLSIAELIGSGLNSYNNYYIAFVFYLYNTAKTGITDATLVVTNKTFGDVTGVGIFTFYPQGDGTQTGDYVEGGIHYPVIPMLQDTTYVGRQFAVLACLCNTGPQDPVNYAYEVLPNNYSCIPLGFDANRRWDYALVTADSAKSVDMLTGVLNSGPTLTFVRQLTGGWNEYSCAAWVTADISSKAGWSGTQMTVHVEAYAPYGSFGAPPTESSSYGVFEADVSVSVPSGGHTNTRQLVQLPNVFIYKDAPHEVAVSAKFVDTSGSKPFSNVLTITD